MAGGKGTAAGGKEITFLEAIRQAMFEEMERDPAVLLMGEVVGVYGGAFKTSEGLLGRRRARRAVSFREPGNVFRAYAGTEGDLSVDAVRRQGAVEGCRTR